MNKKRTKIITIIVISLILIWLFVGVIDFFRVKNYEKPIFSIQVTNNESGNVFEKYQGLGYYSLLNDSQNEIKDFSYYEFYILGEGFSIGYRSFSQKIFLRNLINIKTILVLLILMVIFTYLYKINNKIK